MSNTLAIASVTATLQALLTQAILADSDLADATVTTLPPGKARDATTNNQLNIFLYLTLPNITWRNMDIPGQVMRGETGIPPLALNLYYLLTAYGRNDDDVYSQRLLASAMRMLHDDPLLYPEDIRAATANQLAGSDLARQVERVRFTLQPLSVEEIFRLWSGFQTHYRLSASYEASVVLIDSQRPVRTPLPVLTRGPKDGGVIAQPSLVPPFPTIENVVLPGRQVSALVSDLITIQGYNLAGGRVRVSFTSPFMARPHTVQPEPGATATQLSARIPKLPAGQATVAVAVNQGSARPLLTNGYPLAIAPQIVSIHPDPLTPNASGLVSLTLTCNPEIRPDQRASLLVADQEILAEPHPTETASLKFSAALLPGEYYVRLRVDGVDSLLVDRAATPPRFDPSQKVTVQ